MKYAIMIIFPDDDFIEHANKFFAEHRYIVYKDGLYITSEPSQNVVTCVTDLRNFLIKFPDIMKILRPHNLVKIMRIDDIIPVDIDELLGLNRCAVYNPIYDD